MEASPLDWNTFAERMDEAKDAALHRRDRLAYLGGSVTWRIPNARIYITAEDAAKQLGVSPRRVRVLCEQRRIPGARRSRAGKGRGWLVPAERRSGGDYFVSVSPKTKGPALRAQVLSTADLPF